MCATRASRGRWRRCRPSSCSNGPPRPTFSLVAAPRVQGGRWKVTLGAPDSLRFALKLYDDVRNAGYPAEMHPVPAGNKHLYNVRIANLASKAEAEALAASLKGRLGADEAPRVSM